MRVAIIVRFLFFVLECGKNRHFLSQFCFPDSFMNILDSVELVLVFVRAEFTDIVGINKKCVKSYKLKYSTLSMLPAGVFCRKLK